MNVPGKMSGIAGAAAAIILMAACMSEATLTDPEVLREVEVHANRNDALGLTVYGASRTRRPVGCREAAYRQFDFWVGGFNVVDASVGGTNRITRQLNRCVIREDFISGDGIIHGKSINTYDRSTDSWVQYFVDDAGTNFRLFGGLIHQSMVMTGDRLFPLADGSFFPVIDRVTWTPLELGKVEQLVELSIDGGASFPFVTYQAVYEPTPHLARAEPNGSTTCSTEPYRQLDAWVGTWNVRGRWGNRIGRSKVTRSLSGCLLEEEFHGRRGYRSQSLVSYDFTTEQWNRIYVDNTGRAVRLDGAGIDGRIDLVGLEGTPHGDYDVRVTLQSVSAHRFVQTWSFSRVDNPAVQHDVVLIYTKARR